MEVTQLIAWEALIFLFALFGIVVIQILTGAINARGLLEGTTSGGTRFKSTGRVQLLIATIVTAVQGAERPVADPPKEISPKRKDESKWRNEKASILSSGQQHWSRWLSDCSLPKRPVGPESLHMSSTLPRPQSAPPAPCRSMRSSKSTRLTLPAMRQVAQLPMRRRHKMKPRTISVPQVLPSS